MLKHRVQSGLLLGAAVLAAAFWAPMFGVLLILLLVCGLATWEFYGFLNVADIANFRVLGTAAGLALITATWATLTASGGSSSEAEWVVLVCIVTAVFVRQFPQKYNVHPLQTMAGTLFGVLYVPFLLNFLTRLLVAFGGDGRFLVLYLIAVVKFTDIGAYFVGCAIGRHKLFPRLSPAKSWEGTAGGLVTAVAASLVFYGICKGDLGVVRLHFVDALVLPLVLAIAAVIGDLAESLLKRAAGVKDSGVVIQGMGGVLDLIDSLLFAAPALYVYVLFFLRPVTLT